MYVRTRTGEKFDKLEDALNPCMFKEECGNGTDCDGCREFCRTNPEDAAVYLGLTLVRKEGDQE